MAKIEKAITCETVPLWPDAGQMIGIGRASTYKAAQRGDIPTIRIGGSLRVPKRKLLKMLGAED
jgi:hypothetical protein